MDILPGIVMMTLLLTLKALYCNNEELCEFHE